jgi:hypothetical protein
MLAFLQKSFDQTGGTIVHLEIINSKGERCIMRLTRIVSVVLLEQFLVAIPGLAWCVREKPSW